MGHEFSFFGHGKSMLKRSRGHPDFDSRDFTKYYHSIRNHMYAVVLCIHTLGEVDNFYATLLSIYH